MGTIKIGSSANRKGITVEPRAVLFNGSNVKKIMSGVVTIWSNLKALVPTMTSNTTPSGVASASSFYASGYEAWKAFDNGGGVWNSTATSDNWLQYKFENPVKLEYANIGRISDGYNNKTQIKYKIQVSTDGVNWKDVSSEKTAVNETNVTIPFINAECCVYCRVLQTSGTYGMSIDYLQFYGSQLVGLVPTMTSNTTPSGVASASTETSNAAGVAYAYKAFTNEAPNATTGANYWYSIKTNGEWLEYKFERNVVVKMVKLSVVDTKSGSTMQLKVQAYKNNEWVDISNVETCTSTGTAMTPEYITCNNDISSTRIRILRTGGTCEYTALGWVQYYG